MSPTPDPAAVRIARAAENRYGIDRAPTGRHGDVGLADAATARAVAARMNEARAAGGPYVVPGDLAALSLLHEISHLLVERYEAAVTPAARARAAEQVRSRLGADGESVLRRFTEEFPGRAPTPDDPASIVGELLLTRLANENPAATPLRELFDDRPLAAEVPYSRALEEIETFFEAARETGDRSMPAVATGETLLDLLRAPARHSPTSLAGQLRYVRDHWPALLGDDLGGLLERVEVTLGVLVEEELGLHRRFGGGPRPDAGVHHDRPDFTGQEVEVERFSVDSAWMPRLVLMAKSTYVWLDQLSRRHERDIRTLDAIPDVELDRLRDWGITGLWLIGLWQRSVASETIKRRRGNPEAVASAYSLDDYRIADDLGGEAAYANLRDRAASRGIRLASDMVPNHMGIDSRWVVEHPDWFLSVPEPPYPAYSFSGPDLSPDRRVSIVLEDHYWDATDAAVVFKHHDHASGISRYIYHGNDGTSFPWNDTAQLDFIKAEVREQVIQTILDVARRFPVIRFDAAMVLARKHVERLWWPLPGAGDGIPSRAEHAMRKAAFERLMPTEFWRDVVDRVAAEVPDTLLLAEAFWLLEGYFVRTLGMHRVYNSAFMHMLRDEDNAGYRKVIRETLEFDPAILERYVNFMSNPDEETAIEQFGSGDKYLGVATLLVTLPGLPMLGHGQVEGFTEKYGMEFRRPRLDERPDPALVERHERQLFPLVHRRGVFAGAGQFLLYDLVRDDGTVDENVFVYSNGDGEDRYLVVFHNAFAETAGRIRRSVPFAVKAPDGTKSLVTRSVAEALGVPADAAVLMRYRDEHSGLEHVTPAAVFHDHGLRLAPRAYETRVLNGFREVRDAPGSPWSRLAGELGDTGVRSLDDALRDLELRPVHQLMEATVTDVGRLADLMSAIAGVHGSATLTAEVIAMAATSARGRLQALEDGALTAAEAAVMASWIMLDPLLDAFGPGIVDDLRLTGLLEVSLVRRWNLEPEEARGLGATGRAVAAAMAAPRAAVPRLATWVEDARVAGAIGLHTSEGVDWLDGDRFANFVGHVARAEVLDGSPVRAARSRATRLQHAVERSGYRVDGLRARSRERRPQVVGRRAKPR